MDLSPLGLKIAELVWENLREYLKQAPPCPLELQVRAKRLARDLRPFFDGTEMSEDEKSDAIHSIVEHGKWAHTQGGTEYMRKLCGLLYDDCSWMEACIQGRADTYWHGIGRAGKNDWSGDVWIS